MDLAVDRGKLELQLLDLEHRRLCAAVRHGPAPASTVSSASRPTSSRSSSSTSRSGSARCPPSGARRLGAVSSLVNTLSSSTSSSAACSVLGAWRCTAPGTPARCPRAPTAPCPRASLRLVPARPPVRRHPHRWRHAIRERACRCPSAPRVCGGAPVRPATSRPSPRSARAARRPGARAPRASRSAATREDRPQLLEDPVAALGARVIAGVEDPLDAEAHERHRPPTQRRCTASAPSRCRASAGSAPAGSAATRSSSLRRAASARGLQHRLLPGAVGVERQHHRRREAPELADLLVGQRRAHQADRVAHAGLVRRRSRRCSPRRGPPPRPSSAWRAPGGPRRGGGPCGRPRCRRLFRYFGRCPSPHRARAEAEHAPAQVAQREHDPRAEAVVQPAPLLRALRQARRVAAPPR